MAAAATEDLLDRMRLQCLSKGCGGIKELSVVFRRMDIDFSKRITLQEFKNGLRLYGMTVSDESVQKLFNTFDKDLSGSIDFNEFITRLRPHMNSGRRRVVNEAFDKLDVNKDGVLKVDDLQGVVAPYWDESSPENHSVLSALYYRVHLGQNGSKTTECTALVLNERRGPCLGVVYSANAQKHPKYISGEMTIDQILHNFIDTMDTPGCPDGKVTRDEFLNYYSGVSATIDDDCYFDLMMRNCYALPQRGHNKN